MPFFRRNKPAVQPAAALSPASVPALEPAPETLANTLAAQPAAQSAQSGGFPIPVQEGYVQANNLNMWYVEAGQGSPLILLHGATVSNGPIWADKDIGLSWGGYLGQFAEHHRVIAYDTRGHGRTLDPSHTFDLSVFADDLLALIQALHLDKPILCGFSMGGAIASVAGFKAPDVPRAIVNFAGVSQFNPDPNSQGREFARLLFGGDPRATVADVSWMDNPSDVGRRRINDFEGLAGPGYMKMYWERIFTYFLAQLPYTFADYAGIAAPTLILSGDRDEFCTVEEATSAFRALPTGELGILPGTDHGLPPQVIATILDYLRRLENTPQAG